MFRTQAVKLSDGRRAVIRRARRADAKGVIVHVNAVGAEGVHLMTEKFAISLQQEREDFRKADGKSGIFLVAVIDGEIVGTADFTRGRHLKNRHVGKLGIALAKDVRGVGLGTAMMISGMNWARSVGIRKLTLGVFATNKAALALYRRLGFAQEGRLKAEVILRGRPVDEILMAHWLDRCSNPSPRSRARNPAPRPTDRA